MARPRAAGLTREAFLALYDERSKQLLAYFAQRTLSAEVAADLTAETFAEAFATRGRFDAARGAPAAWLWGIARHQLATYLRTLRVERRARQRLEMGTRPVSEADLARIEELIDFAVVGRQLGQAVRELSADQRIAVTYRVVDDLSYAQIAERLGCSQDVARARVSRGLRLLGRQLAAAHDDQIPEEHAT